MLYARHTSKAFYVLLHLTCAQLWTGYYICFPFEDEENNALEQLFALGQKNINTKVKGQ